MQLDHFRHNILVLGPTGSDKYFIASAFGNVVVRHDFTVRYQRTSGLLHALTLARADVFLHRLTAIFGKDQSLDH